MNRMPLQHFWRSAELVLIVAMWLLATGVFYLSRNYPSIDWAMGGPPSFYPRLLAVLLISLSIAVLVEGLRAPTLLVWPELGLAVRVGGGLAAFILAAALLQPLGFRVVGGLLTFALMCLVFDWRQVTARHIIIMACTAFAASAFLAFLFEDLAGRRLPRGTLF
jgi:hypothetical protein